MAKKTSKSGRPLQQVAALPFRISPEGEVLVLVVTSRQTGRAVLPKGWPMKKKDDWQAARIEARQEAGVTGKAARKPCGRYRYWKRLGDHFAWSIVTVFPLEVQRELSDWPEKHQRIRLWLPAEDAALMVDETDLGSLIRQFADELRKGLSAGRKDR